MKNRLLSVDVLRGMTLIFMIIVNTPGSWDYVYAPLLHADWNGLTPTDYIFPNFLFIVGVSIVLSLNNRINELNRNQVLKKIIWRAFYPETEKEIKDYKSLINESLIRPMNLQLRIMNADGTDKKQITFNEGANFAPYFFPNDQRIIFCSNMADPKGRDFDLWAVNTDGTNLERVTYFNGFDGFPVFSPDGKYFVFASNRNQAKRGDTNIFIAEWQD